MANDMIGIAMLQLLQLELCYSHVSTLPPCLRLQIRIQNVTGDCRIQILSAAIPITYNS